MQVAVWNHIVQNCSDKPTIMKGCVLKCAVAILDASPARVASSIIGDNAQLARNQFVADFLPTANDLELAAVLDAWDLVAVLAAVQQSE